MADIGSDPIPTAASLYLVIRQVRPLFKRLLKAVEDNLTGSGIDVPMRGVLERLIDAGPQSVPQIARALLIQRQFTQRVVNALLKMGLVERLENVAHKRSWLIGATPKGHAAFETIRRREVAVIAEVARGLDAAEVETCRRVLAHLNREFGTLARRGATLSPPRGSG